MELSQNIKNFSTSDIYGKMNLALMQTDYLQMSTIEKKNIIDKCLHDYLASKVLELQSDFDVKDLNSCELVSILNEKVSPHLRDEALSNIIHYLLSSISTIQSFEVYWEIDSKLDSDVPTLHFKNFVLDKLETGMNVNYYKTFGILYEFFSHGINKFFTESEEHIKLSLKKEK